jgi:predicted nucleic acid-binding protein
VSVYLDTSVLVSLFVHDSHRQRVLTWLGNQANVSVSAWTVAEFSSALSHYQRTNRATADQRSRLEADFDSWLAGQPDPLPLHEADMVVTRRLLRSHLSLRTPDALHLAIALNRRLALATLDDGLMAAAMAEGVSAPI